MGFRWNTFHYWGITWGAWPVFGNEQALSERFSSGGPSRLTTNRKVAPGHRMITRRPVVVPFSVAIRIK